jgi:AraC-like DNA-binding protein
VETTDRTVASIAAEVGYGDPGTFSALFARRTGRRPADYRATFRPPAELPQDTHIDGAAGDSPQGATSAR